MKLFRINLNKLEDNSKVLLRQRNIGLGFLLLTTLFVGITVLSFMRYSQLRSKSKQFGATIVSLVDQIDELEQGENYISESQVLDLYELTSKRIFWSEKLEATANLVDTAIAITGLSYQRDKLYLRGITRAPDEGNRFATISAFIDSLKVSPSFSGDFNTIEFSSSERTEYMNKNIITFEVLCSKTQDN